MSFLPNDMTIPEAKRVLGLQRLYAADIHDRMVNIITIAWHLDLQQPSDHPQSDQGSEEDLNLVEILTKLKNSPPSFFNTVLQRSIEKTLRFSTEEKVKDSYSDPVMLFSKGVVYINNIGAADSVQAVDSDNMPTMSTLWAVRDKGSVAEVLYRQPCNYGPMALYDYTYTTPGQDGDDDTEPSTDQTIWILTRSPGMATGHSTKNGSVVSSLWVADIAKMATE